MKDFQRKIQKLRPDLSNWLVHFAKGKPAEAKSAIQSILDTGLKNNGKGLCFTETPICGFQSLFEVFAAYPKPMYAPYGIAIRKEWFFARGGRPVIYLPNNERQYLHADIAHLFEEYEPGVKDFTWLREWRSKAEHLPLSRDETIVIVPSEGDAEGMLFEWEADGEYEGPDEYSLTAYRDYAWYYVTLEEIAASNKNQTCDEIVLTLLSDKGRYEE